MFFANMLKLKHERFYEYRDYSTCGNYASYFAAQFWGLDFVVPF